MRGNVFDGLAQRRPGPRSRNIGNTCSRLRDCAGSGKPASSRKPLEHWTVPWSRSR